jgi:SAM-dependent methyltransferase
MDWHSRFLQQAAWTRDLRSYLFKKAGLDRAARLLEVGCGTGAVLSGLAVPAALHGLDLDFARLVEAHNHAPTAICVCGNALALPYSSAAFDLTFCHYLLLWVGDPLQTLKEMKRVTRSGGSVLVMAEPDYASRLDQPETLAPLGRWQAEALRQQGADPTLGSRLASLFQHAGIRIVETGTLQADGGSLKSAADRELEWAVLESDLSGRIPAREFSRLKALDDLAWERGERVLYIPTYFAWGMV